jgi:hypothetical protein
MSGVDLATVKEILGYREIEMTFRYSHLAPAHKASAMEKLGEALDALGKTRESDMKEMQGSRALATNLAQSGTFFLVRRGRGLSVVVSKTSEEQGVSPEGNWWRRGELN